MGRPRKTDRIDELAEIDTDSDRDADRKAFESEMPNDSSEAVTHIPPEDWPPGKALRWVAIEVANQPFNTNWSAKTRAGWTPVMRGQFPRIDARYPSVPMPGMEDRQQNQAIIFGGLCLCMRDMRLEAREKAKQQRETEEAHKTIDTYVEGGTAVVPRFSKSGPVQMEHGRPVAFKE